MTKKVSSGSSVAKKTTPSEKPVKKARRLVFKSDQWYASAAMSIGIAGRAKGSRSAGMFMPRAGEGAE